MTEFRFAVVILVKSSFLGRVNESFVSCTGTACKILFLSTVLCMPSTYSVRYHKINVNYKLVKKKVYIFYLFYLETKVFFIFRAVFFPAFGSCLYSFTVRDTQKTFLTRPCCRNARKVVFQAVLVSNRGESFVLIPIFFRSSQRFIQTKKKSFLWRTKMYFTNLLNVTNFFFFFKPDASHYKYTH